MAGKLDTQEWIDATKNGRAYAFFARDDILWDTSRRQIQMHTGRRH